MFFFFKQKTAYEMRISDWSSDVCSSDLRKVWARDARTGNQDRVVKSIEEVKANAGAMLGHVLVTKQTGPAGKEVKRLYIEEGCDIARELYLGMLIDRATSRVTLMASTEGGMEIEEVAAAHPEKQIGRAHV